MNIILITATIKHASHLFDLLHLNNLHGAQKTITSLLDNRRGVVEYSLRMQRSS